jgi:hypothetical protein
VSETRPPSDTIAAWILRAGVACCFIGHGAMGLSRTAPWIAYFAVAHISPPHAFALMPWLGAVDVVLAVSVLVVPIRAVVLYMAFWASWAALLRPLAGESAWEMVERAGNFGAPLALFFLLRRVAGFRSWFIPSAERPAPFSRPTSQLTIASWTLRLAIVLLLLGHGMLQSSVHKPMFCSQYSMIGLPGTAIEPYIGGVEILLAAAVLLRPARPLLVGIVFWKLATEALCPMAGMPLWMFIEHGASYAAPLALVFLDLSRQEEEQALSVPILGAR